jgi:flavodoxin
MDPKRALVVFYSRTGTTKIVGDKIAQLLQCDCEELVDRRPRQGLRGYLRASFDATFRLSTELAPPRFDPSAYDLVLIGTPIWNASVSAPIRTYLEANRDRMKQVAFFCTHGSSGSARVLRQLEQLAAKAPVATLVLRTSHVHYEDIDRRLHDFVDAAERGMTARRSAPGVPSGPRGHVVPV